MRTISGRCPADEPAGASAHQYFWLAKHFIDMEVRHQAQADTERRSSPVPDGCSGSRPEKARPFGSAWRCSRTKFVDNSRRTMPVPILNQYERHCCTTGCPVYAVISAAAEGQQPAAAAVELPRNSDAIRYAQFDQSTTEFGAMNISRFATRFAEPRPSAP